MLGHSSYRLRKFTPEELNVDLRASQTKLSQIQRVFFYDGLIRLIARIASGSLKSDFVIPKNETYTIEKRQRYVWLLGIPFFPAGTYWCVRLGSGSQFEIPLAMQETVRAIPRKFIFPWRSLIVVYGLIIGFGGWLAQERYYEIQWQDSEDRQEAEEGQKMRQQLHHPVRGELYDFEIWYDNGYGMNGEVFLRVDTSDGTQTTFSAVTENFSSPEYHCPMGDDHWREAFRDSAIIGTYTISQSELEGVVKKKYFFRDKDARIIPVLDKKAPLLLCRILEPK